MPKLLSILMAVILFLVSCPVFGSELSRKGAEVQIKKAMSGIVKTASVREGDFLIYGFGWQTYVNLANMGFISAHEHEQWQNFYISKFSPVFRKFVIETSATKTFTRGLGHDTDQHYTDNKVLLWRVNYSQVTGIKKDNSGMSGCGAQVVFTCKVEKSPFVTAFMDGNSIPGNLISLTACFSEYDDGWRLENINVPTWIGGFDSSIRSYDDQTNLLKTVGTIGKKTVWQPKGDATKLWLSIHNSCSQKPNEIECIAEKMKKRGASPQAVAFTKMMKGEVYLSSFEKFGKVDLAVMTRPLYNDPNVDDYLLVNGSPEIVYLWENARNVNWRSDPMYGALASLFPKVELWPMHSFKNMEKSAEGGQRFVFDFMLLNGCHACEVAGSAQIAFDFDQNGLFEGARTIRLVSEKTGSAAPGTSPDGASENDEDDASSVADHTGNVLFVQTAGGYTYIKVDENGDELWVAVMETRIDVGDEVTFPDSPPMFNFSSKSMGMTFDKIIFVPSVVVTSED